MHNSPANRIIDIQHFIHILTTFCVFGCDQAEEAQDQYQSCMADAGVRKMDLANAKSTFLTQIREMVFQCDLTLKAVSGHDMMRSKLTSRVTERDVD